MKTFTLRKRDVPALLLNAFPHYSGRKFAAEVANDVVFHDLHWSGGTRNEYRLVPLVEGAPSASLVTGAPWNSPTEGARLDIPAGFAVVQHSVFLGKDCGLRFHVRPDDVARLLPQGESKGSFGVRWKQWNQRNQLLTKERVFLTREKRDAFIEQLQLKHTFNEILATLDEVSA